MHYGDMTDANKSDSPSFSRLIRPKFYISPAQSHVQVSFERPECYTANADASLGPPAICSRPSGYAFAGAGRAFFNHGTTLEALLTARFREVPQRYRKNPRHFIRRPFALWPSQSLDAYWITVTPRRPPYGFPRFQRDFLFQS